jgi:multidrug resistance efflux pump
VATARQADADVIATKASVESARINLAYTKVTSPISGRIGKSSVTEGRWSPTVSRMPWLPSSSSIPSMST